MEASRPRFSRSLQGAFGGTMPSRNALLAIALAVVFSIPAGALGSPSHVTVPGSPHDAASIVVGALGASLSSSHSSAHSTVAGPVSDSPTGYHGVPSSPSPPSLVSAPVYSQSPSSAQLAAAQASLGRGDGPAARASIPQGPGTTSTASSLPSGSLHPEGASVPQSLGGSTWAPLQTPLQWFGVSMAYDSTDGYVVEFGGTANSQYTGTTWEFNAGVWTQATPTISPGSREGAAMTYDAADGYVLLFGGSNGAAALGDTWEFKAGQWTLLQPATSPSARLGAAMTYDTADGYVVLFGGLTGSGASLGDTWEYKSGAWTPLTPSSHPSSRSWASVAYDSADGYVLLLGGSTTHTESDTWTFVAGVWTNISASAGTPGARMGAATTYDGADHYVVLFGGASHGALSDTWKFTGGTWASVSASGPAARYEAGLAYDSFHHETILFGGIGAGQPPNIEFWTTWNYGGGSWSEFSPGGSPSARDEFGMVWDAADGYVLLFGGINGATYLGDTWSFKGGKWTEIESAQATAGQCTQISNGATVSCPVPRAAMSVSWDGFDNYVALFGGFNGGDLGDSWKFSGGAWTELEVVGSGGTCNYVGGGTGLPCPSPREWASFADYYPNTGYAVLFGGTGSGGALADTWEFQWGAWTALTPSTHPSARYGAAAATEYSSGTGYVLLFGGFGSSGSALSDTWEYEWQSGGPTWIQQSPSSHPSARGYSSAADGNPAVLFGGDAGTSALDDTWTYQAGQWTQVTSLPSSPDVRNSLGIVDDTTDGYYLLFGGADLVYAYGDTWTYGTTLTGTTPTVTRSSVELGQAEAFTTGASGGGSGSYSYYWGGLPPGCTPSGTAASLSCTPTATGTFYVNSVVIDSDGNAPATSLTTTISVYGDPTTTTPTGSPWSIDLNQQVTFRTTTSGGTGTYTWTWSGLPNGCSSANSSAITCTPATTGTSSITVSVRDTHGFSATGGPLPFAVLGDPTASTPSSSKFSVDVNQPVTYGETPSGGASSYYRYSWNGLPTSCPSANASALPCTPSNVGTYTIGVTVTDANGYAVSSPSLNFIVHANPTITLAENRTVLDIGESILFWANATGGSGTYSIWYQGLPCATANTSALTCVPTATGTFTITAHVNDTLGGSAASGLVSFSVVPDVAVNTWFSRGGTVAYANQSLILQLNYSLGNPNYRPCLDALGSTFGGISCGAWQGGPNYPFGFWYTQPGTYTLVASVEDSTGWNTTVTLTETIYWPLAKGTATLPSVLDSGMLANGTAQIIHGIPGFSVFWNDTTAGGTLCLATPSSDGSSLCQFSPGWLGSHTVETTVRDAHGMAWYANNTLLVNPALHRLYANASVGAYSATLGGTLQDEVTATTSFSAQFAGGTGPFTDTWSYNGSAMGGGTSVSYAWSHAATYTVTFLAQDSLGKTISGTITVRVNPTATNLVLSSHFPQLDVGTSDNLTLNFSGGLSPFSYSWNFGDGTTKSTSHPWALHSWSSAGPFTATVTLSDGAGIQLQTTVHVVVVSDPQVLNITAQFGSSLTGAGGTLYAYPNGTVSFAGFFLGGIGPYQLLWSANGTPIKSQQGSGPWFNATKVWTGTGSFLLTFQAIDVEGHTTSASLRVVLRADVLTGATLSTTWMALDEGVSDNLTLAFQGGLGPFSYSWNLGDGSTPTTTYPSTTHAWSSSGSFSVSVVVHDSLGASATASLTVTVAPPLSVGCAPVVNATTIWAGDPLVVSLSCVGNGTTPYSLFWTFGDGGTLATASTTVPYAFNAAGNYSVRALVNDSGGGSVLSRALHIQVLTVAEVTPVIESSSYVVDSVAAHGAWKEVRLTLPLVVFPGSSTISLWRLGRTSSGLTSAPWRPWGAVTVMVNVTSVNATQLEVLQIQSALGRSSAPYTATLNLSSLFVPGPGGGGSGGLSMGELFLIGTAAVIAVLAAILGALFLARKRKSSLTTSGGVGSEGKPGDRDTPAIRDFFAANPGSTKAQASAAVRESTGCSEATFDAKFAAFLGAHNLVETFHDGGDPTYSLVETGPSSVPNDPSPGESEARVNEINDALVEAVASEEVATPKDLEPMALELKIDPKTLPVRLKMLVDLDRLSMHTDTLTDTTEYSLTPGERRSREGREQRAQSTLLVPDDQAPMEVRPFLKDSVDVAGLK